MCVTVTVRTRSMRLKTLEISNRPIFVRTFSYTRRIWSHVCFVLLGFQFQGCFLSRIIPLTYPCLLHLCPPHYSLPPPLSLYLSLSLSLSLCLSVWSVCLCVRACVRACVRVCLPSLFSSKSHLFDFSKVQHI